MSMDNKKWNDFLTRLKASDVDSQLIVEAEALYNESRERIDFLDNELEKFNIILDMTPCTISWIKNDLTYMGVNQTLADICQMSKSEFIGREVGFHTHHKYFYDFSKLLFQSEKGVLKDEISTIIDEEEKNFWIVGTKFNKNLEGIIIGIDITELKVLRDTVSFMEKLSALGEMVAGIVHEINNPLTIIKSRAQMIHKKIEQNNTDKVIEQIEQIENTCDKISKIVKGVKAFVRRGDTDPFEKTNINEVIEDALTICEGKIKTQSVQIEYFGAKEIEAFVNPTQIFQIIVNLITNSIDAIEGLDNKWVQVHLEDKQDNIHIRVVDSGPGVAPELKKKIFQSFFTTKAAGKGTGLGLSLCHKILNEHNGNILIDDQSENTTFIASFPKKQKSAS
jgi:signal transduction histidine kinase